MYVVFSWFFLDCWFSHAKAHMSFGLFDNIDMATEDG